MKFWPVWPVQLVHLTRHNPGTKSWPERVKLQTLDRRRCQNEEVQRRRGRRLVVKRNAWKRRRVEEGSSDRNFWQIILLTRKRLQRRLCRSSSILKQWITCVKVKRRGCWIRHSMLTPSLAGSASRITTINWTQFAPYLISGSGNWPLTAAGGCRPTDRRSPLSRRRRGQPM